ncbi:hypothetical protein CHS0354_013191 [Potamilus streckersoni]|uniref:Uncharacterized protein n=1 Tax=Potamilus streckersoni TaxID=2493646 RepID=A0AAE0W9T8_9BIVA|nr:hypothetical protein CHS0354_013191 [Potamilus streckersoni]
MLLITRALKHFMGIYISDEQESIRKRRLHKACMLTSTPHWFTFLHQQRTCSTSTRRHLSSLCTSADPFAHLLDTHYLEKGDGQICGHITFEVLNCNQKTILLNEVLSLTHLFDLSQVLVTLAAALFSYTAERLITCVQVLYATLRESSLSEDELAVILDEMNNNYKTRKNGICAVARTAHIAVAINDAEDVLLAQGLSEGRAEEEVGREYNPSCVIYSFYVKNRNHT